MCGIREAGGGCHSGGPSVQEQVIVESESPKGFIMSSDRSRRRHGVSKGAQRERDITSIDRNADEALRSLVRVLAREAARELFEKSCVRVENDDAPEGKP